MTNYTPEQRAAVVEELERLHALAIAEVGGSGSGCYICGDVVGNEIEDAIEVRIRELKETPDA